MNQYTSYITSEHQKPNFIQIVNALTQPFDDIEQLNIDLNINTATNYMLDILGAWIGQSRALSIPLQIQPAQYDTLLYGGWDSGVYFDEYQATTIISLLDDEDYRFILKLKIIQNSYDGRKSSMYNILNMLSVNALIVDNQNMSTDIILIGTMNLIQQQLISQNIVNISPMGVLVQYHQVNNSVALYDQPISPLAGGWDTAEYTTNL